MYETYDTHGEAEGMFPQDKRCIGYKGISTWESVSVADVNSNSYPPHIFLFSRRFYFLYFGKQIICRSNAHSK